MANQDVFGIHSVDSEFFYGKEGPLGESPDKWIQFDPNDISQMTPSITTVTRNTLGGSREPTKGSVTNEESGVGFTADITLSNMLNWMESFQFCKPVGWHDVVGGTATTLLLAGDYSEDFFTGAVVRVFGAGNDANNKEITLTGVAYSSVNNRTTLTATGAGLVTTGGGLDNASVGLVRYEQAGAASNSPELNTATSAGDILFENPNGALRDFLGRNIGMLVGLGTNDASGDIQNGAGSSADVGGWVRVKSIDVNANTVTFTKVAPQLIQQDAARSVGASAQLDLILSVHIPNQNRKDDRYIRSCYTFGQQLFGLGGTVASGANAGKDIDIYHFLNGNLANTFSLDWTQNALATATLGFMGTRGDMNRASYTLSGTANPKGDGRIAENASGVVQVANRAGTAVGTQEELFEAPLNTTNSFARLRIRDVDDNGIQTVFENVSISLDNNASMKNVVNVLGAYTINIGQYIVGFNGTAIYQAPEIQDLIVENTTISADFIAHSEDGTFAVDIPALTLQDGSLAYPDGDLVSVSIQGNAHRSKEAPYTMAVSVVLSDVDYGNEQ